MFNQDTAETAQELDRQIGEVNARIESLRSGGQSVEDALKERERLIDRLAVLVRSGNGRV